MRRSLNSAAGGSALAKSGIEAVRAVLLIHLNTRQTRPRIGSAVYRLNCGASVRWGHLHWTFHHKPLGAAPDATQAKRPWHFPRRKQDPTFATQVTSLCSTLRGGNFQEAEGSIEGLLQYQTNGKGRSLC